MSTESQAALATTGKVLHYHSNFYAVEVAGRIYQCVLRGNLKKARTEVLAGDQVTVESLDEANMAGRIASVLPRTSQLSRPKIANISHVLILASVASPPLDLTHLDRLVTHALLAQLSPLICLTKTDLPHNEALVAYIEALYPRFEIPVYATSIHMPETRQVLESTLYGKTVVLAGASGVGKSSLINSLRPELDLQTGEVSHKLQRGQHTTRHVAFMRLAENSYVADTPGFSYLKFDTVMPEALEQAFPEFAKLREQCRFPNCLHLDEADCAVRPALSESHPERYTHYRVFQAEAAEYAERMAAQSSKTEYGTKTLDAGRNQSREMILLHGKQRAASRRTQKQGLADWHLESNPEEDGKLDP